MEKRLKYFLTALLVLILGMGLGSYFLWFRAKTEIAPDKKGANAKILSSVFKEEFPGPEKSKKKPVEIEVVPGKIEQVFSDGIQDNQPEAKIKLRKLKGERWKPFLLNQLGSDDPETKFSAAVALAGMRDGSGKNILLERLNKGSYEDRLDAAGGAHNLGDDSGLPVFKKFVSDPDNWYLRLLAVKKIGDNQIEDARNLAGQLVQDPVIPVQVNARAALCQLGNDAMCQRLHQDLESPDTALQYAAAFALAEQGDVTALPLLKKRFEEGDLSVKGHLGYYLALLGDPSGIPSLYQALESGDPDTKYFATWALSQLGK